MRAFVETDDNVFTVAEHEAMSGAFGVASEPCSKERGGKPIVQRTCGFRYDIAAMLANGDSVAALQAAYPSLTQAQIALRQYTPKPIRAADGG